MLRELAVTTVPVAALVPYAENARTHSEAQVAQIAASIAEFGFVNPVLVDTSGVLVAGHGRVMAAKRLGMAAVPAIQLAHLPAGARQKVAQALLKQDLVIGVHRPAYDAIAKWTVDGDEMLLKITDDGLRAIGIDPNAGDAPDQDEQSAEAIARRNAERRAAEAAAPAADTAPTGGEDAVEEDAPADETEPAHGAPTPAPRANLHDAAAAVLAAWDDEANREADIIAALHGPMTALRAALAGKPPRQAREPGAQRKPREGTKQETVLALLRREEGATIAQICEATGWQQHTVRGFFAGLKKRQGIEVKVLERIRHVGPNKEGAKGSYTIYKVTP